MEENILLFTTCFLARESDLADFHAQYLKRVDRVREITEVLYVAGEITHGGDEVIREVMMQDFRRDMRDFGTYPFDESEWGLYSLSCVAKDVDEPAMEGAGVSRLWRELALGEETIPREFTSHVKAVNVSSDGRAFPLGSICA